MGNQIGPGMPTFIIYFLAGLCFLIMISAGFNYTNLSVAKALGRAREVGIRKVSGAAKRQILFQFISEAVIVSLLSLALSFILLAALEPAFRGLKFTQMLQWDLSFSAPVILFCILFAITVGLIAGLFPALFLSGLKPLNVLKDISGIRIFSKIGLRKSLIVAQFSLSLFLIITVRLAQNQLGMMVSADYGFNPEQIINVKLGNTDHENLQIALAQQSSFETVSAASHTPSMGRSSGNEMKKNVEDDPIDFNYFSVDGNYLSNMNIDLLAGKNFPEEMNGTNEKYMIVNRKLTETMGFNSPQESIGEELIIEDEDILTIIGVVEDYNHEPLVTSISPMALRYIPDNFRQLQVKYSGTREDALNRIEAEWVKLHPDLKMEHIDLKKEIAMFYELLFSDLVKITSVISILAISIASLGLLGMAIFTAQSKVKEITIRKVLGADSKSIMVMLSKSYIVLLVISTLISVPLTYLFNDMWLQLLAYRVNVGLGVISFGMGVMLTLGILTILSQTFKAATNNTVESLRGD